MRFIGTVSNENQAQKIALFLKSKGIESRSEPGFEAATGFMSYHLWIVDEDKIQESIDYLARFQKNPTDSLFDVDTSSLSTKEEEISADLPQEEARVKRQSAPLTFFLLGICVFLFMWSTAEEISLEQRGLLKRPFAMTSLQAKLMYDLPIPFEAFQKSLQEVPSDQKFDAFPNQIQSSIDHPSQVSFWQGIYKWLVLKFNHQDTSSVEGPLFSKIFQGELWRLFSPCFLHGGFFHILFNMLWLWILGRPIEERIGVKKTLGLTLIAAVVSNTAQYLVSGPLFLGYSGVIMALAGFIWMRQHLAPWEGYPLNRSTVYFLFLFIGALFVLSFVSFFLQIFTNSPFSPNIANTAHIGGGLVGLFLARSKLFSARVVK